MNYSETLESWLQSQLTRLKMLQTLKSIKSIWNFTKIMRTLGHSIDGKLKANKETETASCFLPVTK